MFPGGSSSAQNQQQSKDLLKNTSGGKADGIRFKGKPTFSKASHIGKG
jgi:hypothetical protein